MNEPNLELEEVQKGLSNICYYLNDINFEIDVLHKELILIHESIRTDLAVYVKKMIEDLNFIADKKGENDDSRN